MASDGTKANIKARFPFCIGPTVKLAQNFFETDEFLKKAWPRILSLSWIRPFGLDTMVLPIFTLDCAQLVNTEVLLSILLSHSLIHSLSHSLILS